MDSILSGYSVNEATWFYLSFLLIIAVFFKFGRFWSVRNLDLVLLLLISPGLLLQRHQPESGYAWAWLFAVTALLLIRTLLDAVITRRPQLRQNMNASGLTFLCVATFAFLMTKVMTEQPPDSTRESVRHAEDILERKDTPLEANGHRETGPAADLLHTPATAAAKAVSGEQSEWMAARVMAVLAHLAVVSGLLVLAYLHLGNVELGLAMAALYLLLPCTAYDVGEVNHVLPSALIIWALVAYRHPWVSGSLIGLACGTLIFPIFLLPLWAVFYGRRGAIRFGAALGMIVILLLGTLVLTSADPLSFMQKIWGHFDLSRGQLMAEASDGFWGMHEPAYRIPVIVTYLVIIVALTIWPRQKTLSNLVAHSAALVIATQFWYPQQGGVHVLWYLPLLLVVMFRPTLMNQLPPQLKPFRWSKIPEPSATPTPQVGSPQSQTPQPGTLFLADPNIPRQFLR